MEEPSIDRRALDDAHRSSVGVRKYRLRPVARLPDLVQPLGDLSKGVVPGDPLELASALRPDAPHRVHKSVCVIRAFYVSIDLGAQEPARERMLGITSHADSPPVLDGDEHRTGVGAVVRASATYDMTCGRLQRIGHRNSMRGGLK